VGHFDLDPIFSEVKKHWIWAENRSTNFFDEHDKPRRHFDDRCKGILFALFETLFKLDLIFPDRFVRMWRKFVADRFPNPQQDLTRSIGLAFSAQLYTVRRRNTVVQQSRRDALTTVLLSNFEELVWRDIGKIVWSFLWAWFHSIDDSETELRNNTLTFTLPLFEHDWISQFGLLMRFK